MRPLLQIHRSRGLHWVGNGFPVRSVFDYNGLGRDLSPFLLLDYAAPYEFAPGEGRRGVSAHPHKGFETVTLAYQGELEHRDSSGGGGRIGPGDVQWMTAGRGIIHEEFHSAEFTRRGGTFQMVQLWVNLPARHKAAEPAYQTLHHQQIPVVPLPGGAGTLRVIAGDFGGRPGPARTFTPVSLWDAHLESGKSADLPIPDGHTAAFLVLQGEVETHQQTAGEGDLAIFSRQGGAIALSSAAGAHLLILAGQPLNEPVVGHGPFVMNSRAEIQQAFEEFQSGKMGALE